MKRVDREVHKNVTMAAHIATAYRVDMGVYRKMRQIVMPPPREPIRIPAQTEDGREVSVQITFPVVIPSVVELLLEHMWKQEVDEWYQEQTEKYEKRVNEEK